MESVLDSLVRTADALQLACIIVAFYCKKQFFHVASVHFETKFASKNASAYQRKMHSDI
jgi:hypothetical protein